MNFKDKNEFRKLKEKDLIEHRPWYKDLYESVKEDIDSLLKLVDQSNEKRSK